MVHDSAQVIHERSKSLSECKSQLLPCYTQYFFLISAEIGPFLHQKWMGDRVYRVVITGDYVLFPENENLRIGKMVLLPSSFSGSRRALKQNFIYSMIIVQKEGICSLHRHVILYGEKL